MASPYRNDWKLGGLGVNHNTRAIFDLMRSRMDGHNLIHLSVDMKIKFMAKTTSKAAEPLDAFKTILKTLQNADVVRKKTDGAFMLNPEFGVRYENSAKQIKGSWVKLIHKRKVKREPSSPMTGIPVPHERELGSLQTGTTFPPLKAVK